MAFLVLPIAVISAAASLLVGLSAAPGPLDRYAPDLAAGDNRRAERALALETQGFAEIARSASQAALRQAPYDNGALLRLAYVDWKTGNGLSTAGLEALRQSYRRVPYDRSVALWRIRFALENWDVLPLDVRDHVRSEVFVVATEPGHLWPLRIRLTGVANPQGRVVASIWQGRIAEAM